MKANRAGNPSHAKPEGQQVDPAKVLSALSDAGASVLAQVVLVGKPPSFADIPGELEDKVRSLLQQRYPDGLYVHQADAIRSALQGDDLCVATSTASGKSLIFMAVAAHRLLREGGKVLVVYPTKALIQDQMAQWEAILQPLGLRAGLINGQVKIDARKTVLADSEVLLMTPDVVHAWLLPRQDDPVIRALCNHLTLVILDEAHVYEGAFGTNVAYLMRRLEAAAPSFKLIVSTATIGDPDKFVQRLTGRNAKVIGVEQDASPRYPSTVVLAGNASFDVKAEALRLISRRGIGRFIAFSDSRRMVERVAVIAARVGQESNDDLPRQLKQTGILPYRAGYENEDRNRIQAALTCGGLAGVISTSALELVRNSVIVITDSGHRDQRVSGIVIKAISGS